jgi:phosphatidylinositol alpha-1,6-mannosyltransferase
MSHDLLVTQDFPPRLGGVARFYQRVAEYYPVGELNVLAPSEPLASAFDTHQKYSIERSRFFWPHRWLWPRWWPLIWRLVRILIRRQTRAIIVGQVIPVGTAVAMVAKFFRVPYVVFTHGMDIRLPLQNRRKKITMLRVLCGARAVIANSEFTKSELVALGMVRDKIHVITPGCDRPIAVNPAMLEKLRHKFGLTDQTRVMLTVARLEERKGIDTNIMALAHIKDQFPLLKYLIVGTGADENRLRQMVEDYKLHDRVIFTGAVTDQELPALYAIADIFVMPARQLKNGDAEGFGIVYLEANSYGLPVIGGRSGGVPEAIQDGQTGWLVDPGTSTELIQILKRALGDKELMRRTGAAGLERAMKKFAWSDRSLAVAQLMRKIR